MSRSAAMASRRPRSAVVGGIPPSILTYSSIAFNQFNRGLSLRLGRRFGHGGRAHLRPSTHDRGGEGRCRRRSRSRRRCSSGSPRGGRRGRRADRCKRGCWVFGLGRTLSGRTFESTVGCRPSRSGWWGSRHCVTNGFVCADGHVVSGDQVSRRCLFLARALRPRLCRRSAPA